MRQLGLNSSLVNLFRGSAGLQFGFSIVKQIIITKKNGDRRNSVVERSKLGVIRLSR